MKKRCLSVLLALAMVLSLLPVGAFAEEGSEHSAECTCRTACTAENMNSDCPVCGAEDAVPKNCGKYVSAGDESAKSPSDEPRSTDGSANTPGSASEENTNGADGRPQTAQAVAVTLLLPAGLSVEGMEFVAEYTSKVTRTAGEDGTIAPIVISCEDEGAFSAELAAAINRNASVSGNGLTAAYSSESGTLTVSGKPTASTELDMNAILTAAMAELYAYDAAPAENAPHTHCVCGSTTCTETTGGHSGSSTTWVGISNLSEITGDGNYYLTGAVTLSSMWTCNYNVNLCLNGQTITSTKTTGYAIQLASGHKVAITDCQTGGTITAAGSGVKNLGTFTLWSGSISSSGTDKISVDNQSAGTFTMNGGSITGSSKGVRNSGTFTMNSGSITGCGDSGVYNHSTGTFTMNGGSITNCTGSGVYISSGAVAMNGGSITDNSGGGVSKNDGTFSVSGTATIKDNTGSNVYLTSGQTIAVGSGKTLSSTASIGITGTLGQTVVTGTTSATGFFCDTTGYGLKEDDNGGLKLVECHTHCVCGSATCTKTDGGHSGPIEWQAWSGSYSLPTEAGNYYLTGAVKLSSTWKCNKNINICLNGKTISYSGGTDAINVEPNATLVITDCQNGGVVDSSVGLGVYVQNGATFILWNGKINTTGTGKLGIDNVGTFTMNGGSVTSNYYAVENSGTFTMDGGSITGGSVGVYNQNGHAFTMNDGSIAASGNGVYILGGNFIMEGGSITGCGKYGVFIKSKNCTFTMNGGSITGNVGGGVSKKGGTFSVSGTATIKDNTGSNVNLPSGQTIAVESGKKLSSTASIGITGTLGQTVVTGTTDTTGFFCDSTGYGLKEDDNGGLKLVECHTHCVCGSPTCTKTDGGHSGPIEWKAISNLSDITGAGSYYLTQDVTIAKDVFIQLNWDVNLCLNGHTISSVGMGDYGVKFSGGHRFAITDCHSGSETGKITTDGTDSRMNAIQVAGEVTLWNGRIAGGDAASVDNDGTFVINGGTIGGNEGVENSGTLTMNDGTISSSVGVYNYATFAMTGGSITGCGTGVRNNNGNSSGNFNMSGGSITNCTDIGVYIYGNTFTMTGGEIKNNTGLGVEVGHGSTFAMSGGTITGNSGGGAQTEYNPSPSNRGQINLSGNVNITGNTKDSQTGNVLLAYETTITVTGALSDTSRVGVTGTPGYRVATDTTDTTVFFSDDVLYKTYADGNDLRLMRRSVSVSGADISDIEYNGNPVKCSENLTTEIEGVQLSGETYTYEWQKEVEVESEDPNLEGPNSTYVTIDGMNTAEGPTDAGVYRLIVTVMQNGQQITKEAFEFEIRRKTLTVNVKVQDKMYDAGVNAVIDGTPTLNGVAERDQGKITVKTDTVSATFDAAEVGSRTVTIVGLSLNDETGNYCLSDTAVQATAKITPKELTVTITASNKVYDGNDNATVNMTMTGDLYDVSAKVTEAKFEDKNVGSDKTVTATIALEGCDASNYTVNKTATTTAAITAKELTVENLTVANKSYDGTNTATISSTPTLDGFVTGETATLVNGTPTFSSVNAGTNIAINFTDFTVTGDAAKNYTVKQPTGIQANIDTVPLTITGATVTPRNYNGSTDANVTAVTFRGLQNGETLTLGTDYTVSAANYDHADATGGNAATKVTFTVALQNTEKAKNYTLSDTAGEQPASIGKALFAEFIGVSATGKRGQENVYTLRTEDLVNGGMVSVTNVSDPGSILDGNPTYADGKLTYKLKAGATEGNSAQVTLKVMSDNYEDYTIAVNIGVAEKEMVTINITPATAGYVYNGNPQSPTVSVVGDTVAVNTLNVTYTGQAPDGTLYSGNTAPINAGSYTMTVSVPNTNLAYKGSATLNFVIQPKALTVTITSAGKTYDGDTTAEVTDVNLSGLIGTDAVTAKASKAVFGNKNVGTQTVTATIALEGNDAKNYTANTTASTTAVITAKEVTITGVEITTSKVYDGNTTAVITNSGTVVGTIGSDTVEVTVGSAAYSDKTVGTGKAVTFTGFALTGADAQNYTLKAQPAGTTAAITAKEVTITGVEIAESKVYDGNTSAQITNSGTVVGTVAGDTVEVKTGSAAYNDKAVGDEMRVTFTGFALTGADAQNYTLKAQPKYAESSIEAKPLTVNVAVKNKPYDGTNTASFDGTPTLVGVAEGDDVTLTNGTPSFASVGVGEQIAVSFTEFKLNGKDSGNYTLTQPGGITASITAYNATGAEYTTTTTDWTNQNFVVTAAEGWMVSIANTADGSWGDGLICSGETANGSVTFYVKNVQNGFISESITKQYKIDKTAPTGEIRIDERNTWQEFLNTISFNLFYKDEQHVTIMANDTSSGMKTIEYLVTADDLSIAQLADQTFTAYASAFGIEPDAKLIAYAKLTDKAGNVTYLRSDGIVLDATAPVINGADNGRTYCAAVTLTITDANLKTVTLNEIPVSLTEGKLTISPAAGVQTVVATDQAGNSTSIAVTINDDHTWGDWVSNGDNTHTKTCSVDATHTKTADCHDGVATCEDLAVCDDCKQPYGELDPKNHTNLQHFPAKAATTTSKGNKEYWYCDGCGKYFSDEAGEKEITKAETVIAKLSKKSDSPKTGDDSNILLWLVLLFISGGALFTAVVFVVRKIADRKRKHTK